MGNTNDRLVKVPNADVWVDKTAVVAVARIADSVIDSRAEKPGQTAEKITMVNFDIRLIDGKSVKVEIERNLFSTRKEAELRQFLEASENIIDLVVRLR